MEFPHLEDLYEELGNEGFTVLAVEITGDRNRAEKFMEEKGIGFPNGYDEGAEPARERYGVYAYPTSFLIDRDGIIRYRHIGFSPGMETTLLHEIRQLLEQPALSSADTR